MKLLILADDFTGAMDTGVQLSKKHIKTLVSPGIPTDFHLSEDCQVFVINTGLRHASMDYAYKTMETLLHTWVRPDTTVYIKTDSALRGNVAAYLCAATRVLGKPLHFIPAFPDADRITRDATVYVNGELLEHSVFSKDPRSPMKKSYIPDILENPWDVPVYGANTADRIKTDAPAIYLYDGATNEDLEQIGSYIKGNHSLGLTAGCAGFAKQFPAVLDFAKEKPYKPSSPAPVCFLSGSANAVTFSQLAWAGEHGYPLLSMSGYLTASMHKDPEAEHIGRTLISQAKEYLLQGKCPILATAINQEDLFDFKKAKELLGSEEAIHQIISECCAALGKSLLDEGDAANLAVFGGDTIASILDALSCKQVEAKGEISTGVPLCLLDYQKKTIHLVSKSGGLGATNIVEEIEKYFR